MRAHEKRGTYRFVSWNCRAMISLSDTVMRFKVTTETWIIRWRLSKAFELSLPSLFSSRPLISFLYFTRKQRSKKIYIFFWHLPENKAKCVELFLSTLIYLPMKSSKYKSEAFPRIEERAKQGELGSAFYLLSSPPPERDLWSSVFRYDIPEKEIKWLSKNLASSLGPVTIW